jgi:maltose/moltooligosaccharide transporter
MVSPTAADEAGAAPDAAESQPPDPAISFGPLRLKLPTINSAPADVRSLLLVLGLPTFGLSFAITVLTTYGPVVLLQVAHSPAKVGALIGGEGAFALVVPLLAGSLSDRLPARTAAGKRVPFIMVGAPLVAAGLVLLPFAPTYRLAGVTVLAFFVGYYLYYPPYRAVYADLLPKRLFARAQSGQAIERGAGLGIALLAGGLLLGLWQPLQFIVGAGVLLLSTLALRPVLQLTPPDEPPDDTADVSTTSTRDLLFHNRDMQLFALANSLWEFSFAGLKTFIVLYVVRGLGRSPGLASAVIAVVAVAYVMGAPLAGRLAERFGIPRVMRWSALLYGVGLCWGVIPTTITPMLVIVPVSAIAGAILMTLPQALAFTVAPNSSQGAAAGLVDFSRGIGVVLGPVAVGAAVGASSAALSSTHGYAVMWPTIGVPILLSLFILRRF